MKKLLTIMILLAQSCFAVTIFSSSNLYGLKDENNQVILNAQYQSISQLEYVPIKTILIPMQATAENEAVKTDYYKIKKMGKYGVANSAGKVIHQCKYDDVKVNEYGEIVLIEEGVEILANPVKNTMKATEKTVETVIGLPVSIVAGVMIPVEMISKLGRK